MNLSNYEISTERNRLSGQLWPRGRSSGLTTPAAVAMGILFFGAGVWVALIGMKVVHVNPSSVHAPFWVLTVFGLLFCCAGIWIWSMALTQYTSNRRGKQVLANPSNAVALADYRWDEKGFAAPRWSTPIKQLIISLLVTAFISMFNWWAFVANGPLMVKIITVLFDAFILLAWYQTVIAFLRATKFGDSRIEYVQFPYYTGEPVAIRWMTPSGIGRVQSGKFKLRCVQQWYESSGSGDNRSTTLIQEEVWTGTWSLNTPDDILAGKVEELRFETSADTPPTNFNRTPKITFWELVIEFREHGLDFKQTYLVPVYSRTPTLANA